MYTRPKNATLKVRSTRMLNAIDLFSGIGGITLGLRDIATPVVFCDIEQSCREVLSARMAAGDLPTARICPDVRILDKSWVRNKKVHLVMGGFPCVGFSKLGLKEGFKDAESGLFHEVVRIVDVFSPPLVFMENVHAVVHMGLQEICVTFWERGYDLRWVTLPASAVGAPHERKRWFCLAVKRGFALNKVRIPDGDAVHIADWSKELEPARMIITEEMGYEKTRCGMLGNAVVPDAVRAAFIHLIKLLPYGRLCEIDHLPSNGYTQDGLVYIVPPMFHNRQYAKLLCFDPSAFQTEKPPSIQLTSARIETPRMAKFWSTPRHGMLGACNYLTERSIRDLPTQVRFEKNTPDELRNGQINPGFVEWIMGYPENWTRV